VVKVVEPTNSSADGVITIGNAASASLALDAGTAGISLQSDPGWAVLRAVAYETVNAGELVEVIGIEGDLFAVRRAVPSSVTASIRRAKSTAYKGELLDILPLRSGVLDFQPSGPQPNTILGVSKFEVQAGELGWIQREGRRIAILPSNGKVVGVEVNNVTYSTDPPESEPVELLPTRPRRRLVLQRPAEPID